MSDIDYRRECFLGHLHLQLTRTEANDIEDWLLTRPEWCELETCEVLIDAARFGSGDSVSISDLVQWYQRALVAFRAAVRHWLSDLNPANNKAATPDESHEQG